jgi:hypothetical protein
MTEGGEVVGWMAANEGTHQQHSYIKGMTQSYYHSSLSGVKAVKALIAFHEDLYKFAEKCRLHIVITSSVLPNKETFNRILTKNGWHVSGDRLVRRTCHYPTETRPPANREPIEERRDGRADTDPIRGEVGPETTTYVDYANPLN